MTTQDSSVLEDIYDTIITTDFLHNKEKEDLQERILKLIYEFMSNNPHIIADENFDSLLQEYLEEEVSILIENVEINEVFLEELEELVEESIGIYFSTIEEPRSFSSSEIIKDPNITYVNNQLNYLRNLPQPVQRTPEWYTCRHNLITASNAYKTFESEANRNQLIFEKCKPLIIEEKTTSKPVNTDSPLHWGQKYEPLAVLFYEYLYKTKVEDFGCIIHKHYKFLGASPDGINVDETNKRFGRMLEIKNIFNRDITGIPKKEYWVQTQLQMEVCEFAECDFLETKFDEFESVEKYEEDDTSIIKGIILYFNGKAGDPRYIYKPLDLIDPAKIDEWQENHINDMEHQNYIWIKNIYWKLSHYSCVLVTHNKHWFSRNIHALVDLWDIIEKERKSGFEHRQPKKKNKTISGLDVDVTCTGHSNESVGCLLHFDKDTKIVSLK